jgi:hypothetical protein
VKKLTLLYLYRADADLLPERKLPILGASKQNFLACFAWGVSMKELRFTEGQMVGF